MLLSLKVPVAMNCSVEPADTVGVAGVIVIDTNPVGVRVPGRYNSALEKPVLSPPPARSTFPLFSNVAVFASRGTIVIPAAVKVPAAGSYSSALLSGTALDKHHPIVPVTSRCRASGQYSYYPWQ